ncbi:MAG: hypothetical protein IJO51_07300, partial [Clostridia bacterium]|nr:hypothetical protein [Clostridia bacterium]
GRAGNPAPIFRQFICRKSIESKGAPAKPLVLWGGLHREAFSPVGQSLLLKGGGPPKVVED